MMKKFSLFCCSILIAIVSNAQNIAIPNYNQQKIDFYLGTVSTPSNTLSSGLGNVNGVTFYGSDMFVAGGASGILWYSGVSFNPYNLGGISPTSLTTSSSTIQVVSDASGNIYVANANGTITKFIRAASSPYYSSSSKVTVRFSNGDLSAGLAISTVNSIPTIWVNNYYTQSVSVCRLSDFPAVGYATTASQAPFVKLLTGITNSNNEGIALDATGAVWVASNGTPDGYLNKIKSSRVLTVVNSLNATSNADYALTGSDIEEHGLTGGNKLGGLTYDAIYTNRMYCNDQPNDGSAQSVTRNVLAFVPSSMVVGGGAFSTPVVTSYLQTNPGNGQSAIIPCALLPNASASSTTINSGQTATLLASNCVAGASYQWKDGAAIVGTNASYTTPVLNETKIYTVACINSAACTGTPTNVTVTVTSSCTPPAPPTLTAEAITPSRFSSISSFNKLTASGCAGTVTWNTGSTASSRTVGAAANPSSTYTATCKVGTCVSTAASIELNYITPPAISATPTTLCAGQNATFTATGCTGGTVKWYRELSQSFGFTTTTSYYYTDIGTGSTLSHAPNDYGLLFSHYSYYATCVINGVNSGFSNAQTFTHTPVVNISPTVSNYEIVYDELPVNLTATNLAPGGQSAYAFGPFVVSPFPNLVFGQRYIEVNQNIPNDNFTIEMWIKTSQSNVGIFSAGSLPISNFASDRHIYIDASGILRFRAEPVANASFSSNTVVNDNIWHHIAVTHSTTVTESGSSFPKSKIFVDGKLVGSQYSSNVCFNEQVFRIGLSQEAGSTLFYRGDIDNVRIWNVVRTGSEIFANAQLETPLNASGLVYHAKLNGNAFASTAGGGFLNNANSTYLPLFSNPNYYTYTWTGQNAPAASTATTQPTTGTAGGIYTLNVTPTMGCSAITATTSAFISLSSTIPISPCYSWDYVFLRSGQSSTLTATGCTGTVSWTYNSIASTGNSITVNYPTTSFNYHYRDDLTFICTQSNGSIITKDMKISSDFPTDDNYSTPLNTAISFDVIANDITFMDPNYSNPTNGVLVRNFDGTFIYTPNAGFIGIDTFKYSFYYNGECSGEAIVTITVGNPNPCPALLTLQSTADDIPSGTVIKQASSTNGAIIATNAVTGTAKATYQAKSIQLNAGFKADNGTVFTAEIGGCASTGSTPTMQVNGRFLYDADNQKTILVGANLPLLDDWDFPTSDKLTELEKTGANAVRIEWYMNYGQPARPAYLLTDLDNFLTKCKTNKMIPIVDIHDFTCGNDISVLNSQIIPWWTSAPVLAVINKHKKYLIINLANELGVYRWAGTPATALTTFKNAYKTAITSIRNAGIDVPIMIDAPDCGTTIGAFNTIGAELITHDPKHNLLLSAHAYWADYDGRPEIATAITNNLPIVFGELANKNDESILLVDGSGQPILDINGNQQYVTSYCHYDIDGTTVNHPAPTGFTYQNLLTTCQTNEIGRMIWAWNKDNCSSRQMSSTGNYINLTTFGNDVVNNATYGIKTKAVKSNAF